MTLQTLIMCGCVSFLPVFASDEFLNNITLARVFSFSDLEQHLDVYEKAKTHRNSLVFLNHVHVGIHV